VRRTHYGSRGGQNREKRRQESFCPLKSVLLGRTCSDKSEAVRLNPPMCNRICSESLTVRKGDTEQYQISGKFFLFFIFLFYFFSLFFSLFFFLLQVRAYSLPCRNLSLSRVGLYQPFLDKENSTASSGAWASKHPLFKFKRGCAARPFLFLFGTPGQTTTGAPVSFAQKETGAETDGLPVVSIGDHRGPLRDFGKLLGLPPAGGA